MIAPRMRIMIVEDELAHAEAIRRALETAGTETEVRVVTTLREYRAEVDATPPDIALVDLNLPDGRAVEVLTSPAEAAPFPVLIITSYGNEQTAVEALKAGALDYVVKSPEVFTAMPRTVARALREWDLLVERRRAQEKLRESEERLSLALAASRMGVWEWDVRTNAVFWSPECCAIFGVENCAGTLELFTNALHPEDADRVMTAANRALAEKETNAIEFRIIRPDGEVRWVSTFGRAKFGNDGEPLRLLGIVQDITERKKLEDQLRQVQRIEAIGQLAGGVAHDFNNILTAIIGYSRFALKEMQAADPARHDIEQVLAASNRATVLTQSLLAFSRKQTVNLAAINLNEVIKEFEKFLLRLIREDIALKIACSQDILTVMADRGQIEQVVMNLVTNARDAMPNGGRLVIETGLGRLDQGFIESHGYGKIGEYALVVVSDDGIGMEKKTVSRIFEPFFTTKEQGKGTGLGLSMAYGIVKKHDGFITVSSEPGKGTALSIYLPLVRVAAESGKKEMKEPVATTGGTETILVGEDDAALRRLSTKVLSHCGYRVIEAVDGQDAVDKFTEYGDSIHLVILDAVMPKKNGREACEQMRMVRPDLKVVFVSGYAKDIFADDNALDGNSVFIQKPVSPDELLAKVRALLDREG